MKRLWQGILIVLLVIFLTIGAVIALLYSPLNITVLNRFVLPHTPTISQAEALNYRFPGHFELGGVSLNDEHRTQIERIEASIALQPNLDIPFKANSLLIDGINLDFSTSQQLSQSLATSMWHIEQLAIRHLDFSSPDGSARNASLQLNNPSFTPSAPFGVQSGQAQLQAEQLYWQGEAMDEFYIDLDLDSVGSKVYALSFQWNGAKLATQAEQSSQGWRLLNTQIDGLSFDTNELSTESATLVKDLFQHITAISSVAITNSHFYLTDWQVENLQLNATDFNAPFDPWQQTQASVSLDADNLVWQGQLWSSPIVIAELTPEKINLEQLSIEMADGLVLAKGVLSPESIALSDLDVRGIKWHIEEPSQLNWVQQLNAQMRDLSIDKLSINNAQIINLAGERLWQVSGLDVEGEDLILRTDNEFALWQGELSASANTLNAYNLYSTQPWLESRSGEGFWLIDELYIPLENGAIEAQGGIDLLSKSRPWSMTVDSFGIPASALLNPFTAPTRWSGFGDLTLELSGLSGDAAMLAHSLTGDIDLELRNLEMGTPTEIYPVEVEPIKTSFDRGRYRVARAAISGNNLDGSVEGEGDLLNSSNSWLTLDVDLNSMEHCFLASQELLSQISSIDSSCAH